MTIWTLATLAVLFFIWNYWPILQWLWVRAEYVRYLERRVAHMDELDRARQVYEAHIEDAHSKFVDLLERIQTCPKCKAATFEITEGGLEMLRIPKDRLKAKASP